MITPFRRLTVLALLATHFVANSIEAADHAESGKQTEQSLAADGETVPYLLYLPKDYEAKAQHPLVLFLHGRGESKPPLSTVAKWGMPRLLAKGESMPYIVVSPQCLEKDNWGSPKQQGLLVKLLDEISQKYKVDKNRIYLTGLSMGGYGSWRLAADQAQRFAAVVPVCGGGKPEDASKLKDLPIWVWHGDQDTAVPLVRSTEMVDAIKAAGGTKVRLTTLENIGHNSWEAAYCSPDLYSWLDKQTLASK